MADIFISYARDDDTPTPGVADAKGFVTFLDENLRYEFRDLGPDRPQIWRDTKRIADGAQFNSEIDEALKAASFLVVILSPNWIASSWCQKELEAFARYRSAEELSVRERIVVVCKRHIDADKRPSLLQGQVGYGFYDRAGDVDELGGEHEFFNRGKVRDDRYWNKIEELADYLLRATKRADCRKRQPAEPACKASGRTIYLAKPASDLRPAYDRLVRELTGNGHTVVPDPSQEIPFNSSATNFIDAALKDAEISVHLLGEKAGPTPEDHKQPTVKLQLERAAAKLAGADQAVPGFHRIIWAPKVLEGSVEMAGSANNSAVVPARNPLDVLAKFDSQRPTDKIEGDSLSKFVDFLNQHLVVIAPPRAAIDWFSGSAGDTRLYLYHSPEDTDYVLHLAEALQRRRLETVLPAFEGPDAEIRKFHTKTLSECDAVALCWASASEVWVRAQASVLRDWHGLGRTQQFAYRAVVAAPPPGVRKKAIKLLFPRSEIDVIVDLSEKGAPAPELLDALVPAARASAA